MNNRIKVAITKHDILFGQRMSQCDCPIAKGVKRHFPMSQKVSVGYDYVNIIDAFGEHLIYKLSTRASKFVNKFDLYEKVQPTNFYFQRYY